MEKSYKFIMRIEYGRIKGSISDIAWVARHPLIFIRDLSRRVAIVVHQKFAKTLLRIIHGLKIECFLNDERISWTLIRFGCEKVPGWLNNDRWRCSFFCIFELGYNFHNWSSLWFVRIKSNGSFNYLKF